MIPQSAIEKNMTNDHLLSLDRLALIDSQSAMVTLSVDGQPDKICSYSINVGPIQDPPPVVMEPGRPMLMCITPLGKDAPFDQEETNSHWGPYLGASIHLCSFSDGART